MPAFVARARRRAARPRPQSGYVLGVVLAAFALGMTVITALLGLSFATHASAITQQRLAREARAADGGLEVGVATLVESADPASDCEDESVFPTAVPMQLEADPTDPPADVEVDCRGVLDPAPNVRGDLKILGDTYEGAASPPGGPFDSLADDVTFRHEGVEPIAIVGDVAINEGGAVLGSAGGPGARVSGSWVQGAEGAELVPPATGCGFLSPSGAESTRAVMDADGDGEPICGDENARAQVVGHSAPSKPTNIVQPGDITCGIDPPPGYYGPVAVGKLNAQMQSCGFNFVPGAGPEGHIFWFDAGEDGSLEFVASNTYVFGTPDGSGGCDPTQGGVTVVLGAGTGIDHTDGEVAICGGPGPAEPPAGSSGPFVPAQALLQSETAQTQPTLSLLSTSFSPSNLVGESPANLWAWPAASLSLGAQRNALLNVEYPNGPDSITSLQLRFRSWEEPPTLVTERPVLVQLSTAPGGADDCTVAVSRGRADAGLGTIVDLSACLTSPAAGPYDTAARLDDATLRVAFGGGVGFGDGTCGYLQPCLRVSDIELVANAEEVDFSVASGWSSSANVLSDDGAYSYADPQWGTADQCVWNTLWHVCDRNVNTSAQTLRMEVGSVPAGIAASSISSVLLALDMEDAARWPNPLPDVNLTASRQSPGSPSSAASVFGCEVTHDSYTRSQQTVYIDLSGCAAARSIGDLSGEEVVLTVSPETESYPNGSPSPVQAGVEMPWIGHARLIVTTDTVSTVPDIAVTADEGMGTSFRVHGDTVAPSANVDVNWVDAGPRALFNGGLAIWSLGSSQGSDSGTGRAGVICCGPEEPTVSLTAELPDDDGDSTVRGIARVTVGEDPLGAVSVSVADWQLCDRSGCRDDTVGLSP